MTKRKNNAELAKTLAILAVFTALSYICVCVFRIKVGFLTFDIKDAVITVAAMIFGPIAGVSISLAVALIEMLTISETMLYGFIMNFISSAAFSVSAGFIYKYKRNMLGAVLGLISAVLLLTALMMSANLLITPFYMGVSASEVAKLIPKLLLPFNLTKAVLNASLVMIIYKPISTALKRAGMIRTGASVYRLDKNTIISVLISLLLLIASLVIFFAVLGGDASWFDAIKK